MSVLNTKQQMHPWRRGTENKGEGGREQVCPLVRDALPAILLYMLYILLSSVSLV